MVITTASFQKIYLAVFWQSFKLSSPWRVQEIDTATSRAVKKDHEEVTKFKFATREDFFSDGWMRCQVETIVPHILFIKGGAWNRAMAATCDRVMCVGDGEVDSCGLGI